MSFDYDQLDPGIRGVVRVLHQNGYETTDSGDGVTKPAAGWPAKELIDGPHVAVRVPDGADIRDWSGRLLATLRWDAKDTSKLHIETTFSPTDGMTTCLVCGLDDSMLPQPAASKVIG